MSISRGVLESHAVELLQATNAAQKTQMVPFVSGADVRNRFVHAVEVRSYALSLARAIGLREPGELSLIAKTALLHDVGHPPFGHVGERVLDRLALVEGGFESNAHTVHLLLADTRFADIAIHSVKHAAVIPEFETAPQPLRKGTYERDQPELGRRQRNQQCSQLVHSIVDVADTLANAALDLVDIATVDGPDHVPEARNRAHRRLTSWIGAISAAHRRADDGPLHVPQAVETEVAALTSAARELFIDTELNADIDAVITTTIERAFQQLVDATPAQASSPPCGCHRVPLAHIIQPMSEPSVIELAGTGHLFAALFPTESWWPLSQTSPTREEAS